MVKVRIHRTSMGIIDNQTEKEGWCKVSIDLDQIEAVRPWINEDNKYEHCYIYTKSGFEAVIADDYEDFVAIWTGEHV